MEDLDDYAPEPEVHAYLRARCVIGLQLVQFCAFLQLLSPCCHFLFELAQLGVRHLPVHHGQCRADRSAKTSVASRCSPLQATGV